MCDFERLYIWRSTFYKRILALLWQKAAESSKKCESESFALDIKYIFFVTSWLTVSSIVLQNKKHCLFSVNVRHLYRLICCQVNSLLYEHVAY